MNERNATKLRIPKRYTHGKPSRLDTREHLIIKKEVTLPKLKCLEGDDK